MFNIGFGELLLVALIAILVLKPEDIPKVAQTVGLKIAQIRKYLKHCDFTFK